MKTLLGLPFALLWLPFVGGCGPRLEVTVPKDAEPHLGEAWFVFRAASLGISLESAKARDALMSEDEPPEGFWDRDLAIDAAATWNKLCAPCHGIDGVPVREDLDPPPRAWGGMGPAMGFFFGGDSMRAGLFQKIAKGGEPQNGKPSVMLGFRDQLAREQVWGLIYHLEDL